MSHYIAPLPNLTIQNEVSCPRCWYGFPPEDALWIAEHPDLLGDAKLGPAAAKRFLPTRFSSEGDAIDEFGQRASRMACPNCHLEIPRTLFQLRNIFFSILGSPACGKSYFLTSLAWRLRQTLPKKFAVAMHDTDTSGNAKLHEYEQMQFLNPNPNALVSIEKTQEQGDLYDSVKMGNHAVLFPRPFMFTLQPMPNHPLYSNVKDVSRVISLYDNAGESFLPGADQTVTPVTRHLALANCLLFCFDPTQDPRFRVACKGFASDPQLLERSARLARETSVRQDTILSEAIQRVRRHAGLREDELDQRPLIVVVTKWDAWKQLLPEVDDREPYKRVDGQTVQSLDIERIKATSDRIQKLLVKLSPEVVVAGQGFAKEIYFVPVSATGQSPTVDDKSGLLSMRPSEIKPKWVEIPLMMALHRWTSGLVGGSYLKSSANG